MTGPSGLPVGDLPTAEPVTVDLAVPDVVLAVGAHPDDIEFGAGATLARWAADGCRVHHLVLTDGSKGTWDPDVDPAALVATRMDECHASAARLGGRASAARLGGRADVAARVHFLGRVDGELADGTDERREVTRVVRTVRPDVVLGHDPWRRYRLHPDHRAAGFLTVHALVAARDPHFFAELGLSPHRPRTLLLFEPDVPNHVERADGYEAVKLAALLCHTSQLQSTMGVDPSAGPDDRREAEEAFDRRLRRQLAAHGALAGVPAGEAFHRIDDL